MKSISEDDAAISAISSLPISQVQHLIHFSSALIKFLLFNQITLFAAKFRHKPFCNRVFHFEFEHSPTCMLF